MQNHYIKISQGLPTLKFEFKKQNANIEKVIFIM